MIAGAKTRQATYIMNTTKKTMNIGGAICGIILAGQCAQGQNIFVGDYASQGILEFSGGTQSTFATGLDYPSGLAFDASGDLFESDEYSGNIYEWAGLGSTRTTFASGFGLSGPIAFNAAGDLFVEAGNGSAVDELNTSGTVINTITGFSGASGLAFDTAGNLYVENVNGGGTGTGYITKITPTGLQSTFASGLTFPNGLAFNAAGDLFVADGYGNTGDTANGYDTIIEITPGGSKNVFATGLNNPVSIAFDKAGDMIVGDNGHFDGNGDLTEFAANGTESVLAADLRASGMAIQGVILPVPEPSAYAFAGLGFAAMVGWSLKKGKRRKSILDLR